MSDIVELAKNWAADAKVAHTYGVSIRADINTISMVRRLVSEIELLRDQLELKGGDRPIAATYDPETNTSTVEYERVPMDEMGDR